MANVHHEIAGVLCSNARKLDEEGYLSLATSFREQLALCLCTSSKRFDVIEASDDELPLPVWVSHFCLDTDTNGMRKPRFRAGPSQSCVADGSIVGLIPNEAGPAVRASHRGKALDQPVPEKTTLFESRRPGLKCVQHFL